MALKFVVLAAFVACASASGIAAPLAQAVVAEPYDPNPQYSYGYEVQDPLTGDSHGQVESRSGDVVRGAYALIDSDGTRRVVDYTADPINGFNAIVSKQPVARAIISAPSVARLAAPAALNAAVSIPGASAVQAAPLVAPIPGYAPTYYSAPVVTRIGVPGSLVRSAPVVAAAPFAAPAVPAAPWAASAYRANLW